MGAGVPFPSAVRGEADSSRTATIERIPSADSINLDACWEDQWKQSLLHAATQNVKKQVSPKQYQIFELYIVRDWTVRKITRALGVSPGQVYLAKYRVAALLKKEAKRLEKRLG